MKTATILTFLIFIGSFSFGQDHSTKKIKPIKIIALKTLPDIELECDLGEIVLKFSKNLTLNHLDDVIQNYESTLDTSVYTKQEISDVGIIIKSVREYLSGNRVKKLTDILATQIIASDKVKFDIMTDCAAGSLLNEMICKMYDNGEFNLLLNGTKLSSVTKAYVEERSDYHDSECIRYYSQNNVELKECWCTGLFKDFQRTHIK